MYDELDRQKNYNNRYSHLDPVMCNFFWRDIRKVSIEIAIWGIPCALIGIYQVKTLQKIIQDIWPWLHYG